jgi:hypothetical protein
MEGISSNLESSGVVEQAIKHLESIDAALEGEERHEAIVALMQELADRGEKYPVVNEIARRLGIEQEKERHATTMRQYGEEVPEAA